MYFETFVQMKRQLGQLQKWLDAGARFAETKKFEPNLWLTFRLAPDQFPLAKQLQTACDTAKLGASRLTGKEAPVHADQEQTLADLRDRVTSVIDYLDGFLPQDFEGAATRVITTPRWEGKTMSGADYFREHMVPNFYFHVTHVYAILRHNGVDLGKKDFLGSLSLRAPA